MTFIRSTRGDEATSAGESTMAGCSSRSLALIRTFMMSHWRIGFIDRAALDRWEENLDIQHGPRPQRSALLGNGESALAGSPPPAGACVAPVGGRAGAFSAPN